MFKISSFLNTIGSLETYLVCLFQHTAVRRRLTRPWGFSTKKWKTPKVAGLNAQQQSEGFPTVRCY